MWQELIVGAAVVAAGAYAAWAISPATARRTLAGRVRAWAGKPGRVPWAGRLADRLERAAGVGTSDCSGCPAADRHDPGQGSTNRDPAA
jgi:hypothetical protein